MEHNLQYPLKRKDSRYTKPLMEDEDFFTSVINLDQPELKSVKEAVHNRNFQAAWEEFLKSFATSTKKRCYLSIGDIDPLSKFIREYYREEEIRPIIKAADKIADRDIPLDGDGKTMDTVRRVKLVGKPYDWNAWLFDSSQYQMFLIRFGWLTHLSHAYSITRNEKYAAAFNDMISDFLDENPTPLDGTFKDEHCTWDSLSVACRMFTWPEAFITFFTAPEFQMEVKVKMVKSFYEHGAYLRKYHARYGNHACMELRGLAIAAAMFPEFRVSGEWLDYALREFPKYIWQNVYEDGVQFEASPHYHAVVMRDAYEMLNMLDWLGLPDKEGIGNRLEKMFEVLMHLLAPDRTLPRFGDTDLLDGKIQEDVMAIGAVLFKRGDFKYISGEKFPIQLVWKYGIEKVKEYTEIQITLPSVSATYFPIGGYMISRESWDRNAKYLIMRAGVGINGHTHADALSIIAYAYGKELIVDSGIGLYEWIPKRKYIISTRAHNTITVDGQDQHVRNLHWSPPPSAPCKIWDFRNEEGFDYFFASHYGYTRYEDPVIHTRKVLFVKKRYWLIVDLLKARKTHQYDLYFHLPSGNIAANCDLTEIWTLADDANILIVHPKQKEVGTSLESGLLFIGEKYYSKPIVKFSQNIMGDACFTTVLVPYKTQKPEVKVNVVNAFADGKVLEPNEATALEITFDGIKDSICIHHRPVNVEGYLDHTGNRIHDALINKATGYNKFFFRDRVYQEDVVVISEKIVP